MGLVLRNVGDDSRMGVGKEGKDEKTALLAPVE